MSASTAPSERSMTASPRRSANGDFHTVVGTGVGNALEWFDWSIYGTFAPFFAASFFASTDPISAFLSTLAVFAVGFIARPVGGIVFGRFADKFGRKKALSLTVVLIAAGSMIIAIAPTYASIGWGASLLLVIARLTQGLAYGGEQPAAQAYLSEAAPPERRGLWATMIYFSGTVGAVLGLIFAAVLSATLSSEDMLSWGWRIPFALAGIGGLYALYMRMKMHETEQFTGQIELPTRAGVVRKSIWSGVWTHRRSAIQVIGMTVGLTVVYYFWVVSSSSYSIAVLGADPTAVLLASVLANVVFLICLPLWGILSDRIGRKPVMFIGIGGSLAVIYPLSFLIDGNPTHLFVAASIACVFLSAPCAISPAIMCELFPTRIRTVGVALPLAIAVAVFGGTTPYLQAALSSSFGTQSFVLYVMVLLAISAATIVTLPETRGRILTDDSADFLTAKASVNV